MVDLDANGNTAYSAGASEVYVKVDDAQLHPQGGLAGEVINASTQLNRRNIQSMAAVLRNPITQWTRGITILNNGKHDPMSEYFKI
jgi:hypothetical protein